MTSPSSLVFGLTAQIDIADAGSSSGGGVPIVAIGATAVGTLGVVILFVVFWRWMKSRSAGGAPMRVLGKETRKKIAAAIGREDFETAGDLYARAGEHDDAAETYVKGGAFLKAARAYQQSNNPQRAVRYFKEAGEIEQVARIYAENGEHMSAAAEFVKAGKFDQSAAQYDKAGDHRRAAESYERANKDLNAAQAYERAGVSGKSAEAYIRYFLRELERNGGLDAVGDKRQYAKRAGDMFMEAGDNQSAGRAFQQGGFFEESAACMRQTGDFTAAAEMLIRAKRPLLAAEVLEEAGQSQKAFSMRAQAALADGNKLESAEMLHKAGELDRAAALFLDVGQFQKAGEIFEKLDDHESAVKAYVRGEKFAHAARSAEQLGDWQSATEYSRKAGDVDGELRALISQGDFFRAGRLQLEHRRYDDALAALGNIDSRDPIYTRSLELQGDVFSAQNRYEKAYSRYRAALGNRSVEQALHLFFKMARSLEDEQDLTGALDHYKRILAIDDAFEDAQMRATSIKRRLKRSTMPGVVGSGLFSAPDGIAQPERYEILDEVARGGMGIVYKARDTVLGRIVAFKILGENLRENETAVKYFLREARAAAAMAHPNIVTIYDAGEQGGEYYMAMEFVEGTTLKEVIRRKGALPEDQVRFITVHCCRALNYAHGKGIIHRDIKSGNVMITRDKALKIMDFGLAKFMREYQKEHTQQVGTPFYMSPEQIIGKDVDFRSDLYSLGCTVYECATGMVPFTKGDLTYHHVHTKPTPPRKVNPAISLELERTILKMLEKNPNNRFQSANDIMAAVMATEKSR